MKKIWNSEPVQTMMARSGGKWLNDGSKLAWSSQQIDRNEFRTSVDLDADRPNRRRVGTSGVFFLKVKQSTTIKLEYLHQYLQGNIGWDNHVLECMNFFDHCIRQGSSEKMTSIRRNIYPKNPQVMELDRVVEVHKGYYSAARLSEVSTRRKQRRDCLTLHHADKLLIWFLQAKKLMVNIDTANTAFWQVKTVAEIALRMFNAHKEQWSNCMYIFIYLGLYTYTNMWLRELGRVCGTGSPGTDHGQAGKNRPWAVGCVCSSSAASQAQVRCHAQRQNAGRKNVYGQAYHFWGKVWEWRCPCPECYFQQENARR